MAITLCAAVVLVLLLLAAAPARAYVDPGSASLLVQVLIGTFLGAVFAVRLYWRKLKAFFRRGSRPENDAP